MKSHVSKIVVAALFTALLLMNVGVVLSAKSQSKNSGSQALVSDSDSTGTNYKICGLDECEETRTIGAPPFQTSETRKGHYMHCKLIQDSSKNCWKEGCDEPCDAFGDTDTI